MALTSVVAGVLALIWVRGGIGFDLPGLGSVWVGPDRVAIPVLGDFHFKPHSPWEPVLRHGFLYSNWHLFFYLLVLAMIAAVANLWRQPRSSWRRAGLAWALASLIAIYVLFFWTEAYLWALQGTSINRIMLQFAPALLFWMMTVWMEITGTLQRQN